LLGALWFDQRDVLSFCKQDDAFILALRLSDLFHPFSTLFPPDMLPPQFYFTARFFKANIETVPPLAPVFAALAPSLAASDTPT